MNGSEHSAYSKYQEYMYEDFNWAVKLNRITLKAIGLWPNTAKNYRDQLICNLRVFVILLMLTSFVIIPSIHFLIRICSDIILVVDNLMFLLPIITCWVRMLIFWWKKEVIEPIMTMVTEDWLKSRNTQEGNIMIKWAQSARRIVICTYCIMGIGFCFLILLPRFGISLTSLTNDTDPARLLPIQGYYMYDIKKRLQYELTFATQTVSILFGVTAYTGIDNFLGLLVLHVCGQLDILKIRLTKSEKFNDFYASLRHNVMDHERLFRAITIIDDTYNIILLALFIYFAILFALCGFQIINLLEKKNNELIIRLVFIVVIIINSTIHMFLYCVVGELLVIHCDNIYYAVCSQKWYFLSSRDAKNLMFLIIRSRKPIYLTAGRVFLMTIPTFCSLIKTSAGYMSVLLTIKS